VGKERAGLMLVGVKEWLAWKRWKRLYVRSDKSETLKLDCSLVPLIEGLDYGLHS
jgi:hypothetical protein